VSYRFQRWQRVTLTALLCGAAAAAVIWYRSAHAWNAARMIQSLPAAPALTLYFNVDQMRDSGLLDLLAGSKTAEEPDYKAFVEATGFDYRKDLDAVAASFPNNDVYMVVRGRFDWQRLSGYARAQHGFCGNDACSMPASESNRYISFRKLSSDMLALGISGEMQGAGRIVVDQGQRSAAIPETAVWISAPPSVFRNASGLPAGSQSFLDPLGDAKQSVFTIGPAALGPAGGLEIRLDVTCASAAAATDLAQQFNSTTTLLRSMIEREHMTPNPADLSGVLVGGRFTSKDAHMTGSWPLSRGFFEALASGQIH
jgi:hypothetical protein